MEICTSAYGLEDRNTLISLLSPMLRDIPADIPPNVAFAKFIGVLSMGWTLFLSKGTCPTINDSFIDVCELQGQVISKSKKMKKNFDFITYITNVSHFVLRYWQIGYNKKC